jgi:glycine C-acetyltransferase/8-amino-7-oxononanoate synthase
MRSGLLFGSGSLANLGVVPALARRGEVVFHDELCHASIVDGCRLAGADLFAYDHGDAEHLAWGLRQADGRGALIATEGLFGLDGDVAPLGELAALARRYDVRLLVDGPGGRGAVADAGLEDEVDVITGSLGLALGAYGGFAACGQVTARYLVNSARTLVHSTAPSPVAIAAGMAALDLLEEQPRRIEKLQANADALRDGLAREGFDTAGAQGHVVSIVVGDAERAQRIVDAAVGQGAFIEAVLPPAVPDGTARLRLAVMASHTRPELREAASSLARACVRCGFRPGEGVPVVAAQAVGRVFDGDALRRAA